jgi:hypothetical protein
VACARWSTAARPIETRTALRRAARPGAGRRPPPAAGRRAPRGAAREPRCSLTSQRRGAADDGSVQDNSSESDHLKAPCSLSHKNMHDAPNKCLISRHPPSAYRLLRMMKARPGSRQEPPPCEPGFVQVQEQSAAATSIVALRPLQPGVELVHRGSGRRSSRLAERSSTERSQLRGWPCPEAAT